MQLNKAKIRYPVVQAEAQNTNQKARVSVYSEDYKGEYYNLPVAKLLPFKGQARQHFDDESIQALANTIKEHGIRQPLTVLPSDDKEGCYEVVSGERRLRAAKLLNLKSVPCIIIHDRKKAEEISIIENVQRKDLHPVELMHAYKNLLDHKICNSIQEIADKISVMKSSVVDTLNLRTLSGPIQDMLVKENVKNRDFLRELCKAKPAEHFDMVNRYLKVKAEQKEKKRVFGGLMKKSNVVAIMMEDSHLYIAKNKVAQLTVEQKLKLKELLSSLLELTFDV